MPNPPAPTLTPASVRESIAPSPTSRALMRVVLWVATALWAGVVFRFSALPGSQIPSRFSEYGHFGEYAILGALLYCALRVDLDRGRALALAVIVASAYGVTDEFHQHFVVMRTPDVADWGMDTIGATCGALFVIAMSSVLAKARRSR